MHNNNNNNNNPPRVKIDAPDPTTGIGAILCSTPRPGPRDSWACVSEPSVENGDRSTMDEVGTILRRELLTACLDQTRVRIPATEIDAYMAAMGLALSSYAATMLQTVVSLARCSTLPEGNELRMPDAVRETVETNAHRIGTVDGSMFGAMKLARALAGSPLPEDAPKAEKNARRTASELIAGCVLLTSLADAKDQSLSKLSALLIQATADRICRDSGIRGEECEGFDP